MEEREILMLDGSIEKIAGGDVSGIDEIYETIGGRMLSVAFGIVKNKSLAEDVVQDSFLKIAQNVSSFRKRTNGYAWICKIVRNTALNKLKSERLRTGVNLDETFMLSDGFAEVKKTETVLLAEQALGALDELERRVISEKYFAGMTVREIAKILDIPKSTVQHISDRAEKKMRAELGPPC